MTRDGRRDSFFKEVELGHATPENRGINQSKNPDKSQGKSPEKVNY